MPSSTRSADGSDLTGRYVLVVIVEIIVIAALWYLGRHFTQG